MNIDKIRQIEARFWEGQTTEEEEGLLREFAKAGSTSEEIKTYFEQMQALKSAEEVHISFDPPARMFHLNAWSVAASLLIVAAAAIFLWQQPSETSVALSQKDKATVGLAFNTLEKKWDEHNRITSSQLQKVSYYPNKVSVNLK